MSRLTVAIRRSATDEKTGKAAMNIRSRNLPCHRAIVAVDIEASTARNNSTKAVLRNAMYDLVEEALHHVGAVSSGEVRTELIRELPEAGYERGPIRDATHRQDVECSDRSGCSDDRRRPRSIDFDYVQPDVVRHCDLSSWY